MRVRWPRGVRCHQGKPATPAAPRSLFGSHTHEVPPDPPVSTPPPLSAAVLFSLVACGIMAMVTSVLSCPILSCVSSLVHATRVDAPIVMDHVHDGKKKYLWPCLGFSDRSAESDER